MSADRFHTTAWSVVLRAAPGGDAARPALADLCRAYWYPLYAFARRRGHEPADAEDAVQEFFAHLVESGLLKYADPGRGRFRGFLAAAFRQHLARRHEHATAAKRLPPGGVASLDVSAGEGRYAHEPADPDTPDRLFDRAWALSVLDRAMTKLRDESGSAERFDAFRGLLTGQGGETTRAVGDRLGLAEGAVRVAVHRLRRRYAALLRAEVADTLDAGGDVEAELRELLAALGGV